MMFIFRRAMPSDGLPRVDFKGVAEFMGELYTRIKITSRKYLHLFLLFVLTPF
jgi:hypothetical protein